MKTWSTIINAIDPTTGRLEQFAGPNIKAYTAIEAYDYCQKNGLGYCNISDELLISVPCDSESRPEWDKMINHELENIN